MVFLCIAAAVFVLDYFIKSYMDAHFPQGSRKKILDGKIILQNYRNPNGAFELFKGRERLGETLSAGALLSVSWDFLRLLFSKGRKLEKLGLGLALGGGLSNIYDKKVKGYVNDYFSFGVKNERLRRMIFNLSDMCIFLGVVSYLAGQIILLCGKKEKG